MGHDILAHILFDHLRDIILLLSAWDFWELCHPFFTDVPMCVSLSIVFDIWLHSMLSVLRQMLQLLVRWLYLCLSSLIFDCILCHPFLDRCRGCCLHSFLFIHPKTDVAVVYILSSSSIRRHRCNPTEFRKKHGANDLPPKLARLWSYAWLNDTVYHSLINTTEWRVSLVIRFFG